MSVEVHKAICMGWPLGDVTDPLPSPSNYTFLAVLEEGITVQRTAISDHPPVTTRFINTAQTCNDQQIEALTSSTTNVALSTISASVTTYPFYG